MKVTLHHLLTRLCHREVRQRSRVLSPGRNTSPFSNSNADAIFSLANFPYNTLVKFTQSGSEAQIWTAAGAINYPPAANTVEGRTM